MWPWPLPSPSAFSPPQRASIFSPSTLSLAACPSINPPCRHLGRSLAVSFSRLSSPSASTILRTILLKTSGIRGAGFGAILSVSGGGEPPPCHPPQYGHHI